MRTRTTWLWCLLLAIGTPAILAATCRTPFSITFSKLTTTTIQINWTDINNTPIGWEVEVRLRGEAPTGVPNRPMTTRRDILLTGLTPSTGYDVYIRTVCSAGQYSDWNVAIPFTTVLSNPSACNLRLPLKDNGTETFLIDGGETGILGKNVFLQSVDLIIAHNWPSDLKITLESPQGQSLVLSSYSGSIKSNFGDARDSTCSRVLRFAPDACRSLRDTPPPYIGTFSTEGNMRQWRPDTLSKGFWRLIINDRAVKDAGVLKYIKLNFNRQICVTPTDFAINSTDARQIILTWTPPATCLTVKIGVRVNGVANDSLTLFIDCKEGKYIYRNLRPDTDYEFFIISLCEGMSESPESCRIRTRTKCRDITLSDGFDVLPLCGEGCSADCPNTGMLWENATEGDTQDWLVWRGSTDTEITGPDGDVNGPGRYLYIENNPAICPVNGQAILTSRCIDVSSNAEECDMAFSYHMYGADTDSLSLDISQDNGESWNRLFTAYGNQGNRWLKTILSLAHYNGKKCIFRFVGRTGKGPLADIAVDGIEFYGSRLSSLPLRYYRDKDGDGAGTSDDYDDLCQSQAPQGYAAISGDCDDTDAGIYPGAKEIPCNGTDENCNGLADDQDAISGIQFSVAKTDASCNGSADGSLQVSVTGGTPPYSIAWTNGAVGDTLLSLAAGFYGGRITDSTGCIATIQEQEIRTSTVLNVINTGLIAPTCQGKNDGALFIEHNTDFPPYTYQWSNGSTSKYLTSIGEGTYSVTVTDNNQCFARLDKLQLNARPSLVTNVRDIRQPLCDGQSTGFVELITVNGLPPYNYIWSQGTTGPTASQLSPGEYAVTITDKQGCREVFHVVIQAPPPIQMTVVSTENVRCFGEKNGAIKSTAKGGKPPYTYFWNHFAFTDDVFELAAGDYILTITDANGCRFIAPPVTIRQPEPFLLQLDSLREAICLRGKNGYAAVSASGGNGDYNFLWSHADVNKAVCEDLVPGNYSVTSYDKSGCKSSIPSFTVGYENKPIQLNISVLDSVRCHQAAQGSIRVSASTGRGPFDFNWSHGVQYFSTASVDTLSGLRPGEYTVTVTDEEGCTGISTTLSIQDPAPLFYTLQDIRRNVCQDDTSGNIAVTVSGGLPPYSVSWNGAAYTGLVISELPSGTYTGTATDAAGCQLSFSPVALTPESDIQVAATIRNTPQGTATGEICLRPEGGIPPYAYRWSTAGDTMVCLRSLPAGQYTVTVTDAAGCIATGLFTVGVTSHTSDELFVSSARLVPNPAAQWTRLQTHQPVAMVSLVSLTGACIPVSFTEMAVESPLYMLDIGRIPPGYYRVLIVYTTGQQAVVPLVVLQP